MKPKCSLYAFGFLIVFAPVMGFIGKNIEDAKHDTLLKKLLGMKSLSDNSALDGKDSQNKFVFPPSNFGRSILNSSQLKFTPFSDCTKDAYPPKEEDLIPTHVVDLNLPPKQRWTKLVQSKKSYIKPLISHVENLMVSLLGEKIFHFINESLPELAKTLPDPYYEEIEGISEAGGLTVSEVTLYNIFYEVFTVCTSIITQDKQGRILHGRNLDFGLFLGWDCKNHTWRVAEMLRPLVVQLDWRKDNVTVFESVSYTGFLGVVTSLKKGKFALSLDERFSLRGGYIGLLEWIIFNDRKQKWVSFLTREVMERANTFDEALEHLSKPRLMAPVYFILSGPQRGQGAIITRYRDAFNLLRLGSKKKPSESWFLVETNYDHWKQPPFFDNRRAPAVKCLKEQGQRNASLALLYNVLSTNPVLNKLTTYTTLMDSKTGYIETWLRDCPDPCWPW